MNNFGTLYRYEIKKILGRKLTIIVLTVVFCLLAAVNVTEYFAVKNGAECNDDAIIGRMLDDSLFDDMRAGITPNMMTDSLGNLEVENVTYNDSAYRHLFQYLLQCTGNCTKAYNVSEAKLKNTFNEIIDYAYDEYKLTDSEIAYWEARRGEMSVLPTYDKNAGWSNSIVNLYMANFFVLVTIGATLSGIFPDEYFLRTDAIVFASGNGKRRLSLVKLLAGCSVGMIEAILIVISLIGPEFVLYGASDPNASIRLVYGPTVMDMPMKKAVLTCMGIMIIISLFYSVFAMFISQLFRNSTAPMVIMAVLLICSMLNPPNSYRLIAQIASYLPATFPGSWTFTDYRLLNVLGLRLNILQVLPVLYGVLVILLGFITYRNYSGTQIRGR